MLVSFLMQGISLTHPMMPLFFVEGVRLTHPKLPSFLCGELTSFLCGGVSLTHPVLASFYAGSFSYTSRAGFLLREELLSSAVYSENNPLIKELGGSWPRRKVWKSHTQTREGSPRTTWTEQNWTEQSRTKSNKNWVENGHRNESGRKEMDLRSK